MSCYFIEYYEISNESKWFLPGITQMEDALERYYTSFREFQENFYWSASAAKEGRNGRDQDTDRARATRVLQMARMWKVMRKVSITVLMEIAGMHLARRFSVSGHSGWI